MTIFTAVLENCHFQCIFQVMKKLIDQFWVKRHCHGGSYKNRRDNVCLNDNAPGQFGRLHLVDRIGQGHCHFTNSGFRGTVILHKVNLLIVHITIIQTVQIIYILQFK